MRPPQTNTSAASPSPTLHIPLPPQLELCTDSHTGRGRYRWAPTEDGVDASVNKCTGAAYSPASIVSSPTVSPNDGALAMLLDGSVDALWIYADQGYTYKVRRHPHTGRLPSLSRL